MARAFLLIRAAAEAGADAVKFQCYTPDTITIKSDRPEFKIEHGPWKGKTLYDLYEAAQTPWQWFPNIATFAGAHNIDWFASVFDYTSVDHLAALNCPFYKIASLESEDRPLIQYAANTGKPVIVSRPWGNAITDMGPNIYNLHCVVDYPTRPESVNLGRIRQGNFDGFSDHTLSTSLPAAAMAQGATIIEKHLTLSRNSGSPDDSFSLTQNEFADMVKRVHEAYEAMRPTSPVTDYSPLRRSLYVVEDIPKGGKITYENVRSIRPGAGLPPDKLPKLVGARVSAKIQAGTPLLQEHINGTNS